MRPHVYDALLGCKGTNFSPNDLIYNIQKDAYLMFFNIK